MTALSIVEDFNVFQDGLSSYSSAFKRSRIQQLPFQGDEKVFPDAVVCITGVDRVLPSCCLPPWPCWELHTTIHPQLDPLRRQIPGCLEAQFDRAARCSSGLYLEVGLITIGLDPHPGSHTVAALDEQGTP
jgi:hypothetical protein